MPEDITDDIEISSDDSDGEDSDEEIFYEENLVQNVNKKTNKNIFFKLFFFI